MSLRIIVEDEQMLATFARAEEGVKRFVPLVAKDLEREVRTAADAVSQRLSAPWFIEGGGSSYKLLAPEWWAHFLARGTRAHGATDADFLQFESKDGWVRAYTVRGITADAFDVRAVERTSEHLSALFERAVEGGL